ncbi:hypothetical protein AB0E63_30905 [Kribbella sp. NPDC026596]|uniref:hypothetical protein n=1 Tax=Kribbella sp. NPDC026596 TaxID=3155122 RepID=UPI0034035D7B
MVVSRPISRLGDVAESPAPQPVVPIHSAGRRKIPKPVLWLVRLLLVLGVGWLLLRLVRGVDWYEVD